MKAFLVAVGVTLYLLASPVEAQVTTRVDAGFESITFKDEAQSVPAVHFGGGYAWQLRRLVSTGFHVGLGYGWRDEFSRVEGQRPRAGYVFDRSVNRCRSVETGQFAPTSYCQGTPGYETVDLSDYATLAAEAKIRVGRPGGHGLGLVGGLLLAEADGYTTYATVAVEGDLPVIAQENGATVSLVVRGSAGSNGYRRAGLGIEARF
jgi:hypothetical protein